MKNCKNWLFPILTCLIVASLALLPLRLSVLEDEQLTGTVHAEPLSEDSNFPFKPPELPGRLWLMLQWQEMPENLTVMSQELDGPEREREFQRLQKALADLQDILPPGMAELLSTALSEADGNVWQWERYYLRDQTDLSSASFIEVSAANKQSGIYFYAVLDVESGQFVSFLVNGSAFGPYSSIKMGEALMDRLGLDHLNLDYSVQSGDAGQSSYGVSSFRLTECKALFFTECSEYSLYFGFQIDWEAMDSSVSASYGHPTDAASMQK